MQIRTRLTHVSSAPHGARRTLLLIDAEVTPPSDPKGPKDPGDPTTVEVTKVTIVVDGEHIDWTPNLTAQQTECLELFYETALDFSRQMSIPEVLRG